MSILSKRTRKELECAYRAEFGMTPRWCDDKGRLLNSDLKPEPNEFPYFIKTRAHALGESVRWGEPFIFFVAPGAIGWIVPIVHRLELYGGIVGGDIISKQAGADRSDCVNHLVANGIDRATAGNFFNSLRSWEDSKIKSAADRLCGLFYQISGLQPDLLTVNRERASQQREIAETIHYFKKIDSSKTATEDERKLLSLIRAGDRKGARKVLNRVLGRMYLRKPNLAILRAQSVEMMGYLVRTAIEESPQMEPLIEKNHGWMAQIVEAKSFEKLAVVTKEALDDFMKNVQIYSYQPGNTKVQQALDYISAHYTDPISLQDVARATGLSTSRTAHLIKEKTGKSVLQHVHHMRISRARELLEVTDLNCTEIAYEVGFEDQSYFTKKFRLFLDITPHRYRKALRNRG